MMGKMDVNYSGVLSLDDLGLGQVQHFEGIISHLRETALELLADKVFLTKDSKEFSIQVPSLFGELAIRTESIREVQFLIWAIVMLELTKVPYLDTNLVSYFVFGQVSTSGINLSGSMNSLGLTTTELSGGGVSVDGLIPWDQDIDRHQQKIRIIKFFYSLYFGNQPPIGKWLSIDVLRFLSLKNKKGGFLLVLDDDNAIVLSKGYLVRTMGWVFDEFDGKGSFVFIGGNKGVLDKIVESLTSQGLDVSYGPSKPKEDILVHFQMKKLVEA